LYKGNNFSGTYLAERAVTHSQLQSGTLKPHFQNISDEGTMSNTDHFVSSSLHQHLFPRNTHCLKALAICAVQKTFRNKQLLQE